MMKPYTHNPHAHTDNFVVFFFLDVSLIAQATDMKLTIHVVV